MQVMATMIEEADDVSQQLLDTILEHVVAPKKIKEPEAYRSTSQRSILYNKSVLYMMPLHTALNLGNCLLLDCKLHCHLPKQLHTLLRAPCL